MDKHSFNDERTRLLLVLAVLAASGTFALTERAASGGTLGALWSLCNAVAAPVLAFLLGSYWKDRPRSGWLWDAGGLVLLFWMQKAVVFWFRALCGIRTGYGAANADEMSWLLLSAALWLTGARAAEWLAKRLHINRLWLLLPVTAVGCLGGFLPVQTALAIQPAAAFFPLFLLGCWMDGDWAAQFCARWSVRLGALVLAVAGCGAVLLHGTRTLALSGILSASVPFSPLLHHAELGIVLRLGQYALAAVVLLALMSWLPERTIPAVSTLGDGWLSGWFWSRVIILAAALAVSHGILSAGIGAVLILAMTAAAMERHIAAFCERILSLPKAMSELSDPTLSDGTVRRRTVALAYVVVFGALLSTFYGFFCNAGCSLVWDPDGQNLYYTMLCYSREYFLDVVHTLFSTGKLVLPQWDMSIGQGDSVLSVLHLNPFYILAMLFPQSAMPAYYSAMALGQLFLSGLACMAFFHSLGQRNETAVLIGSIVYALSGYCIFTAAKHVYFITFFVLALPLLLWGCERWLQKRSCGLFLAVVFFMYMGGYYYAWMDSLLMAIYLLVRCIYVHRTDIKSIFKDLFQLVGLYLWGFAMAAFMFVPMILNLLGSSRGDVSNTSDLTLFHDISFYQGFITRFAGANPSVLNWTKLGFAGIAVVALMALFLRWKDKLLTPLRALWLVLTGCLFLPIAGKIFNGFGYVSNRWSYGYALLMAAVIVFVLPKLPELTGYQRTALTGFIFAYVGLVLYLSKAAHPFWMVLLLAALAAAQLCCRYPRGGMQLTALITIVALMCNITQFYSPDTSDEMSRYIKFSTMNDTLETSAEAASQRIGDNSVYRTEVRANRKNTFCITDGNGTISYWSVLPSNLVHYYLDFDLDSVRQAYGLWGLDGRASLCALAGVKYYLATEEHTNEAPYGYEVVGTDERSGLDIYENSDALPLGYTYTSYMTLSEFEALTPLERQQAVLQCAVVDDSEAADIPLTHSTPELTTQTVDYQLDECDNLELEDGIITVGSGGGTMTLTFDGVPDSETYVWLNSPEVCSGSSEAKLSVSGNSVKKKASLYMKSSLYYFERSGVSFNLGYSERGVKKCTLTFDNKGTYSFSDLQIVCLPMADYAAQVRTLGEEAMTDVTEDASGISGSITLSEERLLTIAVPYSDGWTLTVDGVETAFLQVNSLYVGAVLPAGTHDVALTYSPPGSRLGGAVSCAAFAGLAVYCVLLLVKRAKNHGNS